MIIELPKNNLEQERINLYLVIIYLTDNAMIYGVCQIVVYALIFSNIYNFRNVNDMNYEISR